MQPSTPFMSYVDLTAQISMQLDELVDMARNATKAKHAETYLTQCTALLSMWGKLVIPHKFINYRFDHEYLAKKVVSASKDIARAETERANNEFVVEIDVPGSFLYTHDLSVDELTGIIADKLMHLQKPGFKHVIEFNPEYRVRVNLEK
ncbi:MAG TPA: hypothetical protein VIE65_12795 [Methylobacter sp.]|jgi:hypothetical protein